jgi:site-specific DNA-methyltransferase (adenine-specific)
MVIAPSNLMRGDRVLDFFAGSGTFGASALAHGRDAVLVDANPEALRVMAHRFRGVVDARYFGCEGVLEERPA